MKSWKSSHSLSNELHHLNEFENTFCLVKLSTSLISKNARRLSFSIWSAPTFCTIIGKFAESNGNWIIAPFWSTFKFAFDKFKPKKNGWIRINYSKMLTLIDSDLLKSTINLNCNQRNLEHIKKKKEVEKNTGQNFLIAFKLKSTLSILWDALNY